MNKKHIFSLAIIFALVSSIAASSQVKYIDAHQLNIVGKALPTPHPYHRIDTVEYKGFTIEENIQARCSAGLAVVFETNSTQIDILAEYGQYVYNGAGTSRIAAEGFDLYIRKDGKWLYASSLAPKERGDKLTLISDMDSTSKECLLYLPNYSEILSLQIGVDQQAFINPLENPFRHKVVIFGSSFTHGVGNSRSGMSYPLQISRNTGIGFYNIACAGNCRLQPYFADYMADISDAEAFVFDAFSNLDGQMIRQTVIPFIEILRAAHPNVPLIFVQTIYREHRNFNKDLDRREADKQAAAIEMMAIAQERFDNIYFIDSEGFTGYDHASSVDGVHPSDVGYMRWAEALQPKLLEVFDEYGIK